MIGKSLMAATLVLLTAGCAESLRVDVIRFNQQPVGFFGRTFSVYSESTQSASLEFQHLAGDVGAALQARGLVVEPPNTPSDLVVQIHYASKDPHAAIYADPAFPGYGWGWHGHGYWAGGWGGPWGGGPWGTPPYDIRSVTLYTQVLEVDIFDGPSWRQGKPQMVYQARASGETDVNDISGSESALITALFSNFPGPSGTLERIYVPLTK